MQREGIPKLLGEKVISNCRLLREMLALSKGSRAGTSKVPEQGRACAHSGLHRPASSLQPSHCSPGFVALRAGVSLGARAVDTVS